jgi:hypothetical protein
MEEEKTFTSHVFKYDETTKSQLMNLTQYILLALIPAIALNKTIHSFVPSPDENKSSFELSFEIVAQLVVLFIGMFFIHRLVTYLPTYSGFEYTEVNLLTPILTFLIIVLSIQSKVGDKTNILYHRLMDVLGYSQSHQTHDSTTNNVKTTQPIKGTPMKQMPMQKQQTTPQISQTSPPIVDPNQFPNSQEQLPSYDIRDDMKPQMQQQPQMPMQSQQPERENISTMSQFPHQEQSQMMDEPMAANDALGGGSLGGIPF